MSSISPVEADHSADVAIENSVTSSVKDAARKESASCSKLGETSSDSSAPARPKKKKTAQQPDIEDPIRKMLLSARMHRRKKVVILWSHANIHLRTNSLALSITGNSRSKAVDCERNIHG